MWYYFDSCSKILMNFFDDEEERFVPHRISGMALCLQMKLLVHLVNNSFIKLANYNVWKYWVLKNTCVFKSGCIIRNV